MPYTGSSPAQRSAVAYRGAVPINFDLPTLPVMARTARDDCDRERVWSIANHGWTIE